MADNLIRQPSKLQTRSRHTLILSTVILAISTGGTIYFDVPLTFETSSPTIAFSLFGGVLGLAALISGLFDHWRAAKSGAPVLEYVPVAANGTLHGNVRLARAVEVTGDFTIVLKLFERNRDADGERSRTPGLRWSGKSVKAREDVLATKCIPVNFSLPGSKPLTGKRNETSWTLEVRAPMRGADFYALFSPRLG